MKSPCNIALLLRPLTGLCGISWTMMFHLAALLWLHHLSQMIAEIYPDMDPGHLDQYFLEMSILCPRNVDVDDFNTRLLESFSGEERVYHSADFADEDGQGIQHFTECL